ERHIVRREQLKRPYAKPTVALEGEPAAAGLEFQQALDDHPAGDEPAAECDERRRRWIRTRRHDLPRPGATDRDRGGGVWSLPLIDSNTRTPGVIRPMWAVLMPDPADRRRGRVAPHGPSGFHDLPASPPLRLDRRDMRQCFCSRPTVWRVRPRIFPRRRSRTQRSYES